MAAGVRPFEAVAPASVLVLQDLEDRHQSIAISPGFLQGLDAAPLSRLLKRVICCMVQSRIDMFFVDENRIVEPACFLASDRA
jgi:hypothetical protein